MESKSQPDQVEKWTCKDVERWLCENGFSQYAETLCKEHLIDGQALLSLTEKDLKEPPVEMTILGDIKRLFLKIKLLKQKISIHRGSNSHSDLRDSGEQRVSRNSHAHQSLHHRYRAPSRHESSESEDIEHQILQANSHAQARLRQSKPEACSPEVGIPLELWKTVLSFVYVFIVFLITAFVMVVVHDRVPEMEKYPPLPDLFLDNMPYVPWAFDACEMTGLVLLVMWFTLLFFHKHRFVLLRRMFSLTGTIFLLRCVTMLITSLSVPGAHLQCSGQRYGDFRTRLNRAVEIWQGFGMSLQGVRTCGDYMFSGHTSCITLLNFFITEYTPRKYYFVHIVSWCLNFFGIFFLLAAHEHYSIDVFMAFYLSSRLFMYYHTLANNRALMQADARRTRIWFPLFAFFESKCQVRVPNQFEWPLVHFYPCLKQLKHWFRSLSNNHMPAVRVEKEE